MNYGFIVTLTSTAAHTRADSSTFKIFISVEDLSVTFNYPISDMFMDTNCKVLTVNDTVAIAS